jgi:hypothetical protein
MQKRYFRSIFLYNLGQIAAGTVKKIKAAFREDFTYKIEHSFSQDGGLVILFYTFCSFV